MKDKVLKKGQFNLQVLEIDLQTNYKGFQRLFKLFLQF
jgi:hypothetical protein